MLTIKCLRSQQERSKEPVFFQASNRSLFEKLFHAMFTLLQFNNDNNTWISLCLISAFCDFVLSKKPPSIPATLTLYSQHDII